MEIHESAENYLEAILILSKNSDKVRSIDVANYLHLSKPSVSVMIKQFRENGYVEMADSGALTLTEKGKEIAERMYERHEVIASILIAIGVDAKTAYEDSCKIEHDISDVSFEAMKNRYLDAK